MTLSQVLRAPQPDTKSLLRPLERGIRDLGLNVGQLEMLIGFKLPSKIKVSLLCE